MPTLVAVRVGHIVTPDPPQQLDTSAADVAAGSDVAAQVRVVFMSWADTAGASDAATSQVWSGAGLGVGALGVAPLGM
jgi:hypothetical protein